MPCENAVALNGLYHGIAGTPNAGFEKARSAIYLPPANNGLGITAVHLREWK